MKKALLVIGMAIITGNYCMAQFSQGMICLSLGVGIHSDNSENEYGDPSFMVTKDETISKKTSIGIGGQYFLADWFSAGLKFGLDNRIEEDNSTDTSPTSTFFNNSTTTTKITKIGLIANAYSNTGRVGLTGGLDLSMIRGNHEDEFTTGSRATMQTQLDEYKVSGFSAALVPGVYVMLLSNLYLFASMGGLKYHSINYDLDKVSVNGVNQDLGGYKDEEVESGFWFDINPRRYAFSINYYFGGSPAIN